LQCGSEPFARGQVACHELDAVGTFAAAPAEHADVASGVAQP
jgi:hypothetical protein